MSLNSAVTVTASELTATQVLKVLVEPLAAQSLFLAAGPRVFDTAGPLRIPKMATATDPSWHGESELITEVNPDFDEVSLLPSTMKSVKVLTRYSNELARQAVVSLDAALRDRLVTDVAAKLDSQFFSASGDGTTTPRACSPTAASRPSPWAVPSPWTRCSTAGASPWPATSTWPASSGS